MGENKETMKRKRERERERKREIEKKKEAGQHMRGRSKGGGRREKREEFLACHIEGSVL